MNKDNVKQKSKYHPNNRTQKYPVRSSGLYDRNGKPIPYRKDGIYGKLKERTEPQINFIETECINKQLTLTRKVRSRIPDKSQIRLYKLALGSWFTQRLEALDSIKEIQNEPSPKM